MKKILFTAAYLTCTLCLSAQFMQQGSKLVGTGNTGAARQGFAVAISSDGNSAIVGGYRDNTSQGAAWVFTRSGTTWSQQETKLVGTGNTGAANQGFSVALSSDGNTAIVGGPGDNIDQGAVWVFTRSGTTWSQQGTKLVGTGNTGAANQGYAVALSSDGNTAIVGGYLDNSNQGAAWVFTRSGTTWSQQGTKLVGTGNIGAANQGISVALSSDGNTAIVGGYLDNSNKGAAWVFTRSGTTWSQQGSKLVGTGGVVSPNQGISVALSGDGNTAIVGGHRDNNAQGAAWVFTRSGTTWSQQGTKLVGTGNAGNANQGFSVALSSDGNRAIVSGLLDNSNQGAVWVFTRSGTTWSQQGTKLVGTGNTGAANQGSYVALSSDGSTAIVGGYADNTNQGAAWVFYNSAVIPVELVEFKGTSFLSGNLLTWQTAGEYNTKGFSVERRQSIGDSWETLGFVVANNKASTYQFTDNTPLSAGSSLNSTSYYRLRQIDNDGKETLSKVISVQNLPSGGKRVKAYPNPVSNILTIDNIVREDSFGEGGNFQILNLLGQQVLNGQVAKRIDVSALPQGTYFLKVGTEQVKFIKQ